MILKFLKLTITLRGFMRALAHSSALMIAAILPSLALLLAADVDTKFHNAPASARVTKNPYEGDATAAQTGKRLYARNCLSCHGKTGKGTGNVPSLVDGKLDSVTPGEVFWFITKGDKDNGMPSWAQLPVKQRWEIVAYVKAMGASPAAKEASATAPPDTSTTKLNAPPPTPPFTDFRYEKPGAVHKITVKDLPEPYATQSSNHGPHVVARRENVLPTTLPGFKVQLYAAGLDNPRTLRTAPNGDIFLTESDAGRIRVFRGMASDGKPAQSASFARGL